MRKEKVAVCGAGGFIGGHLVRDLIQKGFEVTAIDVKPVNEWYQLFQEANNLERDLSLLEHCRNAIKGCNTVYNLAADMGGIGFIEQNKTLCMLNVLINTHLLVAAKEIGVKNYFYSSSACIYNLNLQQSDDVLPLKEADAYPAMPEDGYGWEKLFSERMCRHFEEDFGIKARVARFHNVYGPHGTFYGGREKSPAAICRKIAQAKLSGEHKIDVWGDGSQQRSYMYVDDCVHGVQLILNSDLHEPINLGSSELVSINQLIGIVEEIAGIKVEKEYIHKAPKGVKGRNSDNTRIKESLGWEPSTRLYDGLEQTYRWIYDQVAQGVFV